MGTPLVHWRETMHYIARVFLLLLAILIFLTMLGGCGYMVHMRSVQVENQPTVPSGTSFWVAKDPTAQPAKQDENIRRKIELLLADKGFSVVEKDTAEHFLFFEQETDSLASRMSLELFTGPRGGMGTQRKKGPFDRTLSMRVVSAEASRSGSDKAIWAATAMIRSAPTESPKFDDLLLLATFRHFTEDTGETVVARLNLESKQAHRLR